AARFRHARLPRLPRAAERPGVRGLPAHACHQASVSDPARHGTWPPGGRGRKRFRPPSCPWRGRWLRLGVSATVGTMDADRNLLFGVLALQADLIDRTQFVEACSLWATRKTVPLADLLAERGWLLPADRAHVDYLVERKLQKHGGDVHASLATVG